jgi:hypothetical protein
MRMRKLGSTHSVFFFASTEVYHRIVAATGVANNQVTSEHVLNWTMQETIAHLCTYMPLWAHQGHSFNARNTAWENYKQVPSSTAEFTNLLKEKESHTLDESYGLIKVTSSEHHSTGDLNSWIQERCNDFGVGSTHDAKALEEQEREVAQEKEEQRQIERPPPVAPSTHILHPDITKLISEGVIPKDTKQIISVFDYLSRTSLRSFTATERSGAIAFPHIKVTEDFARTIESGSGDKSGANDLDDFLRPVQWVLWCRKELQLVLLSPFEANAVIDQVRESRFVTLHVYAPRTSRGMRSFEDLRSFMIPHCGSAPNVPSNIINELNLFAGQLYFASKAAYEKTCQMLGLYPRGLPENVNLPKGAIDATRFVRDSEAREALGLQDVQFSENPIAFFIKLTELRRKGQRFLPTHLGQMLHSRTIPDGEFD